MTVRVVFDIILEAALPLPDISNPYQFPFRELDLGQSFLVTDPLQIAAAYKLMRRLNNRGNKHFISRTMTTGRRFWRTR